MGHDCVYQLTFNAKGVVTVNDVFVQCIEYVLLSNFLPELPNEKLMVAFLSLAEVTSTIMEIQVARARDDLKHIETFKRFNTRGYGTGTVPQAADTVWELRLSQGLELTCNICWSLQLDASHFQAPYRS
jgi:hypothetical protein